MNIKILGETNEPRWEHFVKDNASTTFFHQLGWRDVVNKTFGFKSFYLFAEEDGEIAGILPLFLAGSLVFGKRLISIPFSPYGGCAARSQSLKEALVRRAVELCKELDVKYLELRNQENTLTMPTNDKYVTMMLNLTPGEETIWSKLSKNTKTCVRKAEKKGLNIILDSENTTGFYALYCRRMHELGTPVHPFVFFQNIINNFPNTKVATVDNKGQILASQILLHFKDNVIYGWGASSNQYPESYPVHSLFWTIIQNCIANNISYFDLGRSTVDSGTYEFKRRWGAEPHALFYQYELNKIHDIPYTHPSNSRYDTAIKIWRSLPLPIVNRLGPFIRQGLT